MYEKEIQAMIEAAKKAELHIISVYNQPFEVEIKADDSPVTEADKGADEIIRAELGQLFPDYGFLTEESQDTGERLKKRCIFIVDPVDGTKEFVSRNGQFTTNIALVVDHEVVAGVINVPMLQKLYYAVKGQGAYRINPDGSVDAIHVSDRKDHLRAMRSVSFFNDEEKAFMEAHKDRFEGEAEAVGAANKFGALAEGSKDFFFRCSGGTKEWDVCSGDIILAEAGGIMVQPNGEKFTYNREDVYNREGYVMANCRENLFLK
ncbi:MAG: 3'(2'),5'-bisphosphate nucleotidase CysQ [Bacilli bacterium]|nr:3'(2'),5'-bisphosphate nucleotidase CysQ [Bacilli bacterium]